MELKNPPIEKLITGVDRSPKEFKPAAIEKTAKPGTPRAILESIAAGEIPKNRDAIQQILTEANQLLLDTKDIRLLITSVATQAADTPLGNQMREDTIRMLSDIQQLKDSIDSLPLHPENLQDNALIQTIKKYNKNYPTDPTSLAKLLQSNPDFAKDFWEQITGQPDFTGFTPDPKRTLILANLDITAENMKKAQALFATPIKPNFSLGTPIIVGAMGLMFVSQIAADEQKTH